MGLWYIINNCFQKYGRLNVPPKIGMIVKLKIDHARNGINILFNLCLNNHSISRVFLLPRILAPLIIKNNGTAISVTVTIALELPLRLLQHCPKEI